MADKTITAMNSVLILTHPVLYPAGVKIEGFSTDQMISADDAEKSVAQMGVDGKMSVGRVPYLTAWTITLSPDSDSNTVFENIEKYERIQREVSKMTFAFTIPALNEARTFSKTVVTNYNPLPPHGRTIGARAYKLASERVDSAILAG